MCLERADVLAAIMPDKAPILVLNGPFDNPRVVVVALALPNQTRALGETLDCKMAKRKLAINGPLCFQQFEGKFFRHLSGFDSSTNACSFDDVSLPLPIPNADVPILTALDLIYRDPAVELDCAFGVKWSR